MVHASSGKGSTALELVKSRLQNSSHFSAAHIANLQLVAKELSEAVRNLEKQKQAREAEAREREEKILEEQRKQAEKEEKERELLVRKQKQIKEKQDKRGPAIISTAANTSSSGTASPTIPYSSVSGPTSTTPEDHKAAATAAAAAAAADTAAGRKRKKKGKKEEEDVVPSTGRVGLSEAAVVDVASRDELVHHLLAMGFSEPDCLAAIALYGKDMDRALSWLCERPPSDSVSTSNTDTAALLASTNPSFHTHSASSTHKTLAQSMQTVKKEADIVASAAGQSQSSLSTANMSAEQLARVQKEKEELRRINRAWNQKAEDEKRKAEAERKLKEAERHHELLFQQQLLIQQKHQQQLQEQQQLLQQQQMQQMLAQHQRQMLASRSMGGSGNYNDNRLNNNLHNNNQSFQSRQHQQQSMMGNDHRDFGGSSMGRMDTNHNHNHRDSSHNFGLGSTLLQQSQSSASPMNGPMSSGSMSFFIAQLCLLIYNILILSFYPLTSSIFFILFGMMIRGCWFTVVVSRWFGFRFIARKQSFHEFL